MAEPTSGERGFHPRWLWAWGLALVATTLVIESLRGNGGGPAGVRWLGHPLFVWLLFLGIAVAALSLLTPSKP